MSCIKLPVYIVDIIGECVPDFVKYTYGRQIQILDYLQKMNVEGTTKYPLVALYMDFPEKRDTGYYCIVTIPKILIACMTTSTDPPKVRYDVTFKPILYPIYYLFLRYLSEHLSVVENDVDELPHTKYDRPGTMPTGVGQNEYIDAIEINNLTLTIVQQITKT
jgi:hypothetical protein